MIKMSPQPNWEQDPFITKDGMWGAYYRDVIHDLDGIDENIKFEEHKPPSKDHKPIRGLDGTWYWVCDILESRLTPRNI